MELTNSLHFLYFESSSCDSCRIRRVKCDRFDKGGLACTECVKKSIK